MARHYRRPYYETLLGDEQVSLDVPKSLPPPNLCNTNCPKPTQAFSKKQKRILPEEVFRAGLAKWLPQPNDPLLDKRVIRDAVFAQISECLSDFGKYEWSLRPRTFALLWMLGIPEKMDAFVSEERTDHYLPYNDGNLPDVIKGSTLRFKFLGLQSIVRCLRGSDLAELEEGNKHIHFPGKAEAYFHFLENLGNGRFARVDKVYSRNTLKTYALKQIRRGQSVLEDKDRLAAFEKELNALKTISHRHVVKLVGSYTDSHDLGLVMRPVADTDLHQYLESRDIDPGVRKKSLRCFFGCLVTALAYVHKKNIRHKDIKPNNILVKSGQVLLADFGTSRICLDGHLTTNGNSKAGTPRYWAPEVMDEADRNTASDIWSLGCVFLEMATALFGYTHNDMLDFYSQHGNEVSLKICLNPTATRLWILKLRGSGAGPDSSILDWTESMLQEKAADRPTAAQIRSRILDAETDFDYICNHCASEDGIEQSESLASGTMMSTGVPAEGEPEKQDESPMAQNDSSTASDHTEIIGESSAPGPEIPIPKVSDHQLPNIEAEPEMAKTKQQSEAPPSEPLKSAQAKPKQPEKKKVTWALEEDDDEVIELDPGDALRAFPGTQRFTGLPKDQRPEPKLAHQFPPDDPFSQQETFIPPEPIKPPPFYKRDCLPLPQASLVPSYLLAGTNHLSQDELSGMSDDPATSNLFVYGRLMFPSVLHAVATRSLKGAYSPDLQRRLALSSDDWEKANVSVQRASEMMTPAVLSGYTRWQPREFDCPVIEKCVQGGREQQDRSRGMSTSGSNPNGVVGFLITGLRREAVRYLDLLLATTERNLYRMEAATPTTKHSDGSELDSMLQRHSVQVQVEDDAGNLAKVHAHTYVWKHGPMKRGTTFFTQGGSGFTISDSPWNENNFVHSKMFQGLLDSSSSSRKEEQEIANRIKISYALVGDHLCRAVLAHDARELEHLLDNGWHANSPCRVYGSPLQASVVVGNEDMVKLLIDHGADVNAQGGLYGAPIIAAAFAARKSITRLLLHNGASVFATHPLHANALYQAVGHSDYAIAEMLLEHAAWLIEDWGEVRDLVEETGDKEIQSLLREYDVRDLHRRYRLRFPNTRLTRKEERPSWGQIAGVVFRKGAAVQSMAGNWRGRKGVAVVVAALNAGASTDILSSLRKTVGPLQAVVLALRKSDEMSELRHQKSNKASVARDDEEDRSSSEEEFTPGESDEDGKGTQRQRKQPQDTQGKRKTSGRQSYKHRERRTGWGRDKPKGRSEFKVTDPFGSFSFEMASKGNRRYRRPER
ncbi:hypothetical protein FZEAL_6761 [Fusarium zealandicum]|uniref:Protein kinase domain-containing protein n=1 Tax=Fusarium zealandicum TaxID=1053134 RepID=A0A8H4UI52_9HYPO|nr:hypothetical protein FZEAL_6761 [Fusarium zealandicum]